MKQSAGLLLYRQAGPGSVEVLLGHPGGPLFARRDEGYWSIPKGECEPGEDLLAAAYREFAEELGVPAPAGPLLALGDAAGRGRKVNTIWALAGDLDASAVRSNLFSMEWPPRSGRQQEFPELDRAEWFGLDAARRKLFAAQVPFVDRLDALLSGAARPS